jgi:predicted nucleic acid-binding protein
LRQFYLDTNVFISSIKPDDAYHLDARAIARSLGEGEVQAETSVLSLLEIASVSSRLHRAKRGEKGANEKRAAFAIKALRRFASLRVKFIHVAGDSPLAVRGVQANMPSIFNEAILLSLQTALRTLDLIHLAAARYAKQMNGELGAFVTGDEGFLSQRGELSKILGMPILSPKEYTKALGLRV